MSNINYLVAGIMDNFQQSVGRWMIQCFSERTRRNKRERAFRLLEESLELFQATGCTAQEAQDLVTYVFGREPGDPVAEVGDVLLTLAAYCEAAGLRMEDAALQQLSRAWEPETIARIRAKRASRVIPGDYSA